VKTGEIDYNVIVQTEDNITPAGLANSSARLFPAGTLLIAMYGQGVTRGRVAILGIEAATNQACAALFPNEKVTTPFLFAYLTYAYERIRSFAHGAQQKNLSGEIIKALKIPVPPLEEQSEIARNVNALDRRILAAERKQAGLAELFRMMLRELMTGRMRVHAPSIVDRVL
jgi:type I restriction enzyme, S subunit